MLVDTLAQAQHLTQQERAVATYVLKHPGFLESHTARELADMAHVSAATVTRLCQKIGMESFGKFKVEFVAEWKASNGNIYASLSKPLIEPAELGSDEHGLTETTARLYNRIVLELTRRIDTDQVTEVCRLVAQRGAVDLYGTGINLGPCEAAAFKFQTLGVRAQALTAPNIQALMRGGAPDGFVSVLTSHTGENRATLETAQVLKANGSTVVAITPDRSSSLGSMADCCIRTFRTASVDRLSLLAFPISLGFIFDLMYATLLSSEIENMFPKTAREFYAR